MEKYIYLACRDCGWDAVLDEATSAGNHYCPLCAEDYGRDVRMESRPAIDTDKPEGRDMRSDKPRHDQ